MKNTRRSRNGTKGVDMPAEYQLDWSKAKPNPYAARLKDTVAVVLAPDVAEVFPTSESVNTCCAASLRQCLNPDAGPPPRRKGRSSEARANNALKLTRSAVPKRRGPCSLTRYSLDLGN